MAKLREFFSGFSCIGFDMDHTILRYKLGALRKLVTKALCQYLMQHKGYSNLLLERSLDLSDMCAKGILFDHARGNFLKLDHKGEILCATHGSRLLSTSEIFQEYKEPEHWAHVITDIMSGKKGENYFVFDNYFDTPGIPVCARMIDEIDQAEEHGWICGGSKSYNKIWLDIVAAYRDAYLPDAFKNKTGGYFPGFIEQPSAYLHAEGEKLKMVLKGLRQRNCCLFLLTSAHSDTATFAMDFAYGPDWRSLFDVVIVNARKPGFFTKPKEERPFYALSDHREDGKVSILKPNEVYAQGNLAGLMEFLSTHTGQANPKTLFCGDSLLSDIAGTAKNSPWDILGIVEELFVDTSPTLNTVSHPNSETDGSFSLKAKRTCEDNDDKERQSGFWSSYFAHGDKQTKTLSASVLEKCTKLCIAAL